MHAKVSGYIRRISVDIGDRVAAGQVIAVLEVPELSAQVAGAQAQVRHSLSEIDRAKSGVALEEASYSAVHAAYTRLAQAAKMRPGLVAEQELDDSHAKDLDAQARVNAARSALEASQEQLGVAQAEDRRVAAMQSYAVVTAPFNGVITARYADVGSLIQAGPYPTRNPCPLSNSRRAACCA